MPVVPLIQQQRNENVSAAPLNAIVQTPAPFLLQSSSSTFPQSGLLTTDYSLTVINLLTETPFERGVVDLLDCRGGHHDRSVDNEPLQ